VLIAKGFVQVKRKGWRDLCQRVDAEAKKGRGQRPNVASARLVLDAIIKNTGYTTTPDGRITEGIWRTTYKEVADFTGLTVEGVRSTFRFLQRVTPQGKNSVMLLEIQTLMKNQYSNFPGLPLTPQAKTSKLHRVGIVIKPLFLQDVLELEKSNSPGTEADTPLVITKKEKQNLKKRNTSLLADPVLCTPEPGTWSEAVRIVGRDITPQGADPETDCPVEVSDKGGELETEVKGGLVQDGTHNRLASRSEPQSVNAIKQDPVGISGIIAEAKRTADTRATGQAHLTAQRGGITFEQAKERYPQLETASVKYLSYLNRLHVVFYPTHLDDFCKKVKEHDNKPEPNQHDKPIATALRGFLRRKMIGFQTVEKALQQAIQGPAFEYFDGEPEQLQDYKFPRATVPQLAVS
jgi:hypothetical protein